MDRAINLITEILTTVAVVCAVVTLAMMGQGCSAAQLQSLEDNAVKVGNATGECLWKCGLGCAAQGLGTAIQNPPPPAPLDREKVEAARVKLCAEDPAHAACQGGE
jgi:hypothetical protein